MKAMFREAGNRFVSLSALCQDEVLIGSDLFLAIRSEVPEKDQSTIFSNKSILTLKNYDSTTN